MKTVKVNFSTGNIDSFIQHDTGLTSYEWDYLTDEEKDQIIDTIIDLKLDIWITED